MIAINFAGRNYKLIAKITTGLIAGSVVLALTAAGMLWTEVSLRKDISFLDKRVKEAESADAQIRSVLAERELLVKDLNAMSGLLESRRFSWTRLLTSIEAVVPIGVAMQNVAFDPRDKGLLLEGSAQSPEALRNLIVGLEQSSLFRDPFLKHQSLDKGSISFNVVAVYHEGAGAAVVKGKK
jgi:Tfp pilus assembly protein PilN